MNKLYQLVKPTDDTFWYGVPRKALCTKFVERVLGECPPKIEVRVSNESFEDAIHIKIIKTGYYRWFWRFADRDGSNFGMSWQAEEELNRMFDDHPEKGNIAERSIWVSLRKL